MNSSGNRRGHPIRGAIAGLLLGLFVMLDLVLLGTIRIDSIMIYVVPLLGLLAGFGLGTWAPIRR